MVNRIKETLPTATKAIRDLIKEAHECLQPTIDLSAPDIDAIRAFVDRAYEDMDHQSSCHPLAVAKLFRKLAEINRENPYLADYLALIAQNMTVLDPRAANVDLNENDDEHDYDEEGSVYDAVQVGEEGREYLRRVLA